MQSVDKSTKLIITVILTISAFPIGLCLGLYWGLISKKWFFGLLIVIIASYGFLLLSILEDFDKGDNRTYSEIIIEERSKNQDQ
ncbi:MAG: hypothetical protein AAGF07_02585 [Patescibacteria group bacterium]